MKLTKELLLKFYLMHKEIENVEENMYNRKFREGHGFVWLESLRESFYNMYSVFEDYEDKNIPTLLDVLHEMKYEDWIWKDLDHRKISKNERDSFAPDGFYKTHEAREKRPEHVVAFDNIEDVIDYVWEKYHTDEGGE